MALGKTTGTGEATRQNGHRGEVNSTSRPRRSLRDEYLTYCGFQRDPFRTPVAEQEYGLTSPAGQRLIFSHRTEDTSASIVTARAYYVDPLYENRRVGSVFDQLRAPGHVFVYAEPGAGKSTLRFALEADLRGRPDGATLAVTYELEEELRDFREEGQAAGEWLNPHRAPGSAVHRRLLARALTIDLFIQIVEQFDYREHPPTAEQNRRLHELILNLDWSRREIIHRVIERLKSDQQPEISPVWGSAGLWRLLHRPLVRAVVQTPALRRWLDELGATSPPEASNDNLGAMQWARALETAHLWGFTQVCVLVDGLDAMRPERPYMRSRLDPLLGILSKLGGLNVSVKFFLPSELESDVARRLASVGLRATEWRVVRLKWRPERLRALLVERYRVGGARRHGLSDLVTPDLSDGIDAWLIDKASGSPRRLITLVDELIEAHVAHGNVTAPITADELEAAVRGANARWGAAAKGGKKSVLVLLSSTRLATRAREKRWPKQEETSVARRGPTAHPRYAAQSAARNQSIQAGDSEGPSTMTSVAARRSKR